ncbi:MAG TPA: DUF5681 domain-containing protein [Devosiaceae bacterium]
MAFQPGNKHGRGRPKSEESFTSMLRIALKEKGQDGRPRLRALAETLVRRAIDGDIQAIKEIADRLEGKPRQMAKAPEEQAAINIWMYPEDIDGMGKWPDGRRPDQIAGVIKYDPRSEVDHERE